VTRSQELDLAGLTRGLIRDADGIWRGPDTGAVAYPEDGSDASLAVEDTSYWFAHRNRIILDAIRRVAPPPRLFLDIGGGNGFVTRALVQGGYPSVMLEPSAAGAANARARGLKNVISSRFQPSLFQPGQIEIAGLFDVIEHIEDDVGFLRDVAAILRPGGMVAITVPAFQTLYSPDDAAAGHFRRHTRGTVTALMRAAGFQPLRTSYFMMAMVLPVLLLRTIPGRLGIRRGIDRERDRREHGEGSALSSFIASMLAAETGILARGGSAPMGTSCLALGRLPKAGSPTSD
jgi:SAM-dependent methyltransferase